MIQQIQNSNAVSKNETPPPPPKTNKVILGALSAIFFFGMLISYLIGLPWFATLFFFVAALAPLYTMGRVRDHKVGRIQV